MANLYGVANPAGYPGFSNTIGFANISCPAGVYTPVFTTGAIVAPSQGWFFVLALINAEVTYGATVPTSMNFGIQIGAGSPTNQVGPAGSFVASTTQLVSAATASQMSQVAWAGAGSTVTVGIQPAGQAVTVTFGGSWLMTLLMRAPDQ